MHLPLRRIFLAAARTLLRLPLLPVLLIGIANIAPWYGFAFWGLSTEWSLALLASLALIAGWYTQEKLWGTVMVMLVPTMFIGSEHHGQPWQWLVYGLVSPVMLVYFVLNIGPVVLGYSAIVGLGHFARRKLLRRG